MCIIAGVIRAPNIQLKYKTAYVVNPSDLKFFWRIELIVFWMISAGIYITQNMIDKNDALPKLRYFEGFEGAILVFPVVKFTASIFR